jgi:hypothetical protein
MIVTAFCNKNHLIEDSLLLVILKTNTKYLRFRVRTNGFNLFLIDEPIHLKR